MRGNDCTPRLTELNHSKMLNKQHCLSCKPVALQLWCTAGESSQEHAKDRWQGTSLLTQEEQDGARSYGSSPFPSDWFHRSREHTLKATVHLRAVATPGTERKQEGQKVEASLGYTVNVRLS